MKRRRSRRLTEPGRAHLVAWARHDPDDARAVRIRLTARGRAFGKAVRAFVRGVEDEWAERIGSRRFEELKTALELLQSSLLADE